MKRIKYGFIMAIVIIVVFCTGCGKDRQQDGMTQVRAFKQTETGQHVMNNNEIKYEENNYEECQGMITMIGDSILLGASEELRQIFPDCIIDAKKNRQVEEGIEIIKNLDAQEKLGDTVIIALGTNGTFTDEVAEQILYCLGEERKIYWVTAYGRNLSWEDEVNEKIRQLSDTHDNIWVLDWEDIADEHEEWFCEDGIHLNAEGQAGYADFISLQIFS